VAPVIAGTPRDLSIAGHTPEAAGETVTNDQLRLRLLRVEGRLAALEAAQAARPARRKRVAAPRPGDDVIAGREKLWARYVLLDVSHRGRISKLAFAMRYRLNPTEFCRWFSTADRRGVPENSGPDQRFRKVLIDAIGELEARALLSRTTGDKDSHGKVPGSQFFAPRPQ
jgi:hypothetical protein